jgi:hypothetical protein
MLRVNELGREGSYLQPECRKELDSNMVYYLRPR